MLKIRVTVQLCEPHKLFVTNFAHVARSLMYLQVLMELLLVVKGLRAKLAFKILTFISLVMFGLHVKC